MKVALLGDIHGNGAALAAVLDAARRENVQRLLVTGDLVGYYFSPAEVLYMLQSWDTVMVRGNHEDMLARARDEPAMLESIGRRYGSGAAIALQELSDAQLEALCTLPHPLPVEVGTRRVLLCHGAPWDNDVYVYPDADAQTLARCAAPGYDAVVMGHTHHPFVREAGGVKLVNPGSVGQPRNRHPGAHWALLDTQTLEVTLRQEAYDYVTLAAEARRRHPELPYLSDVLTRS